MENKMILLSNLYSWAADDTIAAAAFPVEIEGSLQTFPSIRHNAWQCRGYWDDIHGGYWDEYGRYWEEGWGGYWDPDGTYYVCL